jgi:hypothetical protein
MALHPSVGRAGLVQERPSPRGGTRLRGGPSWRAAPSCPWGPPPGIDVSFQLAECGIDADMGLDTRELFTFIEETRRTEWKLT